MTRPTILMLALGMLPMVHEAAAEGLPFEPGARKARYARTIDGIVDAGGNLVAIAYDDETERELMTFAAVADGYCR